MPRAGVVVAAFLAQSFFVQSLAAEGRLAYFEAVEPHMGTLFRIQLYAADEEQARRAFAAAFGRIAQLDEILSDYKPESELNRLTREAVARPVEISSDLFGVLSASQRLAEASGGAFDVTLGPVIRLWREARKRETPPDAAALEEASARCGWRKLHVTGGARPTAMVDQREMQLDVGGIAKGYAADEALAVIGQVGIRSALVAASGDLAFSDAPPGKQGWRIGLGSDQQVRMLHNCAVSTSGAEQQFLEWKGLRFSHIIDPATHMGLTGDITVTVVARTGAEADGLATTISILGGERGRAVTRVYTGAEALIQLGKTL